MVGDPVTATILISACFRDFLARVEVIASHLCVALMVLRRLCKHQSQADSSVRRPLSQGRALGSSLTLLSFSTCRIAVKRRSVGKVVYCTLLGFLG